MWLKRKGNQLTQGNILKFPVKEKTDGQCGSPRHHYLWFSTVHGAYHLYCLQLLEEPLPPVSQAGSNNPSYLCAQQAQSSAARCGTPEAWGASRKRRLDQHKLLMASSHLSHQDAGRQGGLLEIPSSHWEGPCTILVLNGFWREKESKTKFEQLCNKRHICEKNIPWAPTLLNRLHVIRPNISLVPSFAQWLTYLMQYLQTVLVWLFSDFFPWTLFHHKSKLTLREAKQIYSFHHFLFIENPICLQDMEQQGKTLMNSLFFQLLLSISMGISFHWKVSLKAHFYWPPGRSDLYFCLSYMCR